MVKVLPLKIVWDIEALNQFKEILIHLEQQSVQAPKIVKKEILKRIKLIKNSHHSYEADKLRTPLNDNFRAFVVFSYRVTYQICIELKELRILRLRHTSREPLGY